MHRLARTNHLIPFKNLLKSETQKYRLYTKIDINTEPIQKDCSPESSGRIATILHTRSYGDYYLKLLLIK